MNPPNTSQSLGSDPLAYFLSRKLKLNWLGIWIISFLLYGPIEKLLIPWLFGYLKLSGNYVTWRPDLEALLTGFVEFPLFFAFYLWTYDNTGKVFEQLWQNKSLEDLDTYSQFVRRVADSLDRRAWTVISITCAVGAVFIWHYIIWGTDSTVPPWFIENDTFHRPLALSLIFLVAYAISQSLWRVFQLICWLKRLWKEQGECLIVYPYHPDGAGGLGAIGRYTIRFSYFIMVALVFLIMGSMLPKLTDASLSSSLLWSPVVVAGWILSLVIVPLSLFLLLGPTHVVMNQQCSRRLNDVSNKLKDLFNEAHTSIEDKETLAGILERIKQLKAIRAYLLNDTPTWPISKRVRQQIGVSFLFPVGNFLLTLVLDLFKAQVTG